MRGGETRMKTWKSHALARLAGMVIGLVLVCTALTIADIRHKQRRELAQTLTAIADDGVVEEVRSSEADTNGKRVVEYAYQVSFSDSDGKRHEGESLARTMREPRHHKGDVVSVRYDSADADGACLIAGDEDDL